MKLTVAAQLLCRGRTAHSAIKIKPLHWIQLQYYSNLESACCELQNVYLTSWDEIVMQLRYCIDAVNSKVWDLTRTRNCLEETSYWCLMTFDKSFPWLEESSMPTLLIHEWTCFWFTGNFVPYDFPKHTTDSAVKRSKCKFWGALISGITFSLPEGRISCNEKRSYPSLFSCFGNRCQSLLSHHLLRHRKPLHAW